MKDDMEAIVAEETRDPDFLQSQVAAMVLVGNDGTMDFQFNPIKLDTCNERDVQDILQRLVWYAETYLAVRSARETLERVEEDMQGLCPGYKY